MCFPLLYIPPLSSLTVSLFHYRFLSVSMVETLSEYRTRKCTVSVKSSLTTIGTSLQIGTNKWPSLQVAIRVDTWRTDQTQMYLLGYFLNLVLEVTLVGCLNVGWATWQILYSPGLRWLWCQCWTHPNCELEYCVRDLYSSIPLLTLP